ncbi:MAG TPA: hypothetical protein VK177_01575 [Flavobacteriales bacterium]|nr:hypothetical protein [Flavobacteriales bacterium]
MTNRGLYKIWPIFLLFITACGGNKLDVDVSGVNVTVQFIDWVPALEDKNAAKYLQTLKQSGGELYKYYLGRMIHTNPDVDSQCIKQLDQFMYFPSTVEGVKQIKEVYGDFKPYKDELTEGLKHMAYYYPEKNNFKIFTYHSGFNFGIFPVENEIGIGLDMYLGANNKVTQALPIQDFPQYMKNNMDPANMVVDFFRGYAIFNLIPENKEDDLLSTLVYEGKALYALDAFLPGKEEHVKLRYKKEQLDWCNQYHRQIWKEIIDNEWLYTTNQKVILQFTNEAPFTGSLPKQSPPRVGAWLGWQMIKAYAEQYPDLTVKQILEEPDAKKILRSYKPPK